MPRALRGASLFQKFCLGDEFFSRFGSGLRLRRILRAVARGDKIDDDRILRIVRIHLAKRFAGDLFVLTDTRPGETAKGR